MSLVFRFPAEQDLALLRKVLWHARIGHHYRQEGREQWIVLVDDGQAEQAKSVIARWMEGDRFDTLPEVSAAPGAGRQIGMALKAVPITALLVVAALLVFGMQWLLPTPTLLAMVIVPESLSANGLGSLQDTLSSGQWWRLLSPVLLHFGPMHLAFNLIWIWVFGRQVEVIDGGWRWLMFVILWGIMSNLAQYATGTVLFGGLSGVVYALMGYVWWNARRNARYGYQMPPWLLGLSVFWMVLGLVPLPDAWGWPQMGNGAHAGGLAIGLLTAMACQRGRWRQIRVEEGA